MKAKTMLSTTQYEFSHGRSPRGHGGWAFSFPAQVFDMPTLLSAAQAHNASTAKGGRCLVDSTTYPGKVVLWMGSALYSDARSAATEIAKLGALPRVPCIIGEVAP